ncbi:MAG: hypothetical protein AAF152_08950, partial [Cyanobacteria bacterium P01_A01_bin.114]
MLSLKVFRLKVFRLKLGRAALRLGELHFGELRFRELHFGEMIGLLLSTCYLFTSQLLPGVVEYLNRKQSLNNAWGSF